mmetsp:Transcript_16657/g.33720  ORF Transcript_16657/g.33720 Transcript_16657/m.33720 type:complete len:298 (-) Transcript_16657:485-1378(-)
MFTDGRTKHGPAHRPKPKTIGTSGHHLIQSPRCHRTRLRINSHIRQVPPRRTRTSHGSRLQLRRRHPLRGRYHRAHTRCHPSHTSPFPKSPIQIRIQIRRTSPQHDGNRPLLRPHVGTLRHPRSDLVSSFQGHRGMSTMGDLLQIEGWNSHECLWGQTPSKGYRSQRCWNEWNRRCRRDGPCPSLIGIATCHIFLGAPPIGLHRRGVRVLPPSQRGRRRHRHIVRRDHGGVGVLDALLGRRGLGPLRHLFVVSGRRHARHGWDVADSKHHTVGYQTGVVRFGDGMGGVLRVVCVYLA